jgi:hypothetical protein
MRFRPAWICTFALLLSGSLALAESETLKQRQATIKGLVVRHLPDGNMTGMAMGMVATARGDASGGKISIRGEIGPDMKSALDEAERFVRVTHPQLGNADIEVSFEERASPKDGGSAGTAFAVLLRSLAEGYQIDTAVAITGDIAVNGNVQPIGGVTAKIKGASADGCTMAVIPKQNVPAVSDMLVNGDKLELLRTMQVFAIEKVDDAVALCRKDREEKLAQAITEYKDVQDAIAKKSLNGLKDPATVTKLKHVLELAPNHVTAQLALDVSQNKGPTTLTRDGSVVSIFGAARPFWVANNKPGTIRRDDFSHDQAVALKKELSNLQKTTHPDVQGLRKSMVDWIDAVDRLLSFKGPLNENDKATVAKRRDALNAELKRLDTDQNLVEKMMREGY